MLGEEGFAGEGRARSPWAGERRVFRHETLLSRPFLTAGTENDERQRRVLGGEVLLFLTFRAGTRIPLCTLFWLPEQHTLLDNEALETLL